MIILDRISFFCPFENCHKVELILQSPDFGVKFTFDTFFTFSKTDHKANWRKSFIVDFTMANAILFLLLRLEFQCINHADTLSTDMLKHKWVRVAKIAQLTE